MRNLIRRRCLIPGCAVALVAWAPWVALFTCAAPPAFKSTAQTRYWWRSPTIFTAQELLFLSWMSASFGDDWLQWMPDEVIEVFWSQFQQACWQV